MPTLTEAVELTGKSKSTLTRAIKTGKLSARRSDDEKTYIVDEAELARVFPFVMTHQNASDGSPSGSSPSPTVETTPTADSPPVEAATPQQKGEVEALKQVIEQLEARLEEKDVRLDEKDERIGEYKTTIAQSNNLLSDQRSDTEKARAALHAERSKPTLKVTERPLTLKERLLGGFVPVVREAG